MTTAIVSDLHLGAASGRDLLRQKPALAALTDALGGADELLLLGDTLELREAPLAQVLGAARPVLAQIGRAMAGGRVTIVAGNHDHQLAAPLIERLMVSGGGLGVAATGDPPAEGPVGEIARALAHCEVRVAYPGVWVRDDVYATHGHYLDLHNTVPSLERLAIGAVQRLTRRFPDGRARPDDYEAALAPLYALAYTLAQSPAGRALVRSDRSSKARHALTARNGRLLSGLALPAAVGVLNAAGLGPLRPELSGQALRDSALRSMNTVLDRLGIDAPHVVFGHTHRSGPHDGDRGWDRLTNTGSWIVEQSFLGNQPQASPYFPGHVAIVGDSGPPELRRLLAELPRELRGA